MHAAVPLAEVTFRVPRRNAAFALQAHMPHSDRPYWRSQQLAIYAVLIVLVIGFTRRFRIDHQGADQISGES